MDSLPQEIIDKIIDDLPAWNLLSSSLVARRWRERSQQRALNFILFSSEYRVNIWHTVTRRNSDRILSYVQAVKFNCIAKWNDPALFGHVLRKFTSLTTLEVFQTEILDDMLEQISCGEFRKTITTLHLSYTYCSLSTTISMIIAFPNLQNLTIGFFETAPTEETPACRVLPQRRLLDRLHVYGRADRTIQALANVHFASRHLVLDIQSRNIYNLLVISSATLVELELIEYPNQTAFHPVDLPPFPALTSLTLLVYRSFPSHDLVNTLSCISSAPALASITLQFRWWFSPEPDPPNVWDNLDRWLVQMARNTTVEGGLVLNLVRWQENGVPMTFLPKFQVVGKIIPDNY